MSFLELLGGRGHYDDVESGRVVEAGSVRGELETAQ